MREPAQHLPALQCAGDVGLPRRHIESSRDRVERIATRSPVDEYLRNVDPGPGERQLAAKTSSSFTMLRRGMSDTGERRKKP